MNPVQGQILSSLSETLSNCHDLNGAKIEFKQQQKDNPQVYESENTTDGRSYYIEIATPATYKISIVKK